MSKERIRNLLAQLRKEIRRTDIDDELQALMSELDKDIHGVIENEEDVSAVVERAKELEADFATRYPGAAGFFREVIDLLVRMGI